MCRWLVLTWLATGCGRIGFEVTDGRAVGEVGIDAPFVLPSDLPPFGPAMLVSISVAVDSDDDPSLTGDMLEIFFDSARGGDHDIYTAKRATVADAWGTPVAVAELNTIANDENPHVSTDGLTMYLSSGAGGDYNIYYASRPDRQTAWTAPVAVAAVNSPVRNAGASANAAGTVLVTASDDAVNMSELYESRRATPADAWSAPVVIAGIDTAADEATPDLDDAGLLLFFDAGGTTHDIFWAYRPSLAAPWGSRVPVTEIDTGMDESDPWVSPDLRTIYFARQDLSGNKDIYMAVRP